MTRLLKCVAPRVEAPIPDHLRDSAPNLEKYKVVQILPCRKIEIKKIVNFLVFLFLKLNYCKFLKSKVGLNILPIARVCHNCSFLLALVSKLKDMCHDTIGYSLKI
jgi:hypothetical protein